MFTVIFTRYDGKEVVFEHLSFENAMNTARAYAAMTLKGETVTIRSEN